MNKLLIIVFLISVFLNIFFYIETNKCAKNKLMYYSVSLHLSDKLQKIYIKEKDYGRNIVQLSKLIDEIEFVEPSSEEAKRNLIMMCVYKWRLKEKLDDKEGAIQDIKKIKEEMKKVFGREYSEEKIREIVDMLYKNIDK